MLLQNDTQSPCCWKAKWVTLTDLCKSSQDGPALSISCRLLARNSNGGVLDLCTCHLAPQVEKSALDILMYSTYTNSGSSHDSNISEVEKKPQDLQMYASHFRSLILCAEMQPWASAPLCKGLREGVTPTPKRATRYSKCGSPVIAQLSGLCPKDNIPEITLWIVYSALLAVKAI